MIKRSQLFSVKNILLAVAAILLMLLPAGTQNSFIISTMIMTFTFGALGVSWNLIGGYGAQVSWCHAAFVAIGGYSGFICYNYLGISPFISMFVGMFLSFLTSTIIGYGAFRLRGFYFSLSTIAFAEIVRIILLYFRGFTGGASGMYITFKEVSFAALTFRKDTPFYYICFGLMIVTLIITYMFERSKTGYYLGAIKGDEDAATSLGIKTFKVKLSAFQISAVLTSVIGTIYAFYLTYLEPTSICGMDLSVRIGVVAIVGGLGFMWGPVLGAFVVIPATQIVSYYWGHIGGASQMVYGLLLILVVIFRPNGLISFFSKKKSGDHSTLIKTISGITSKKEEMK